MRKVILITTLVVLAVVGITAGAFFLGQSMRKSDHQVASIVRTSVSDAVRRNTTEQEAIRRKAIDEARAAQKRHDRTVMRRLRRKLQDVADRRAQESYASGQNAGYTAGEREGYVDGSVQGYDAGLTDGSDALDCSDDPDVYWLPPCF